MSTSDTPRTAESTLPPLRKTSYDGIAMKPYPVFKESEKNKKTPIQEAVKKPAADAYESIGAIQKQLSKSLDSRSRRNHTAAETDLSSPDSTGKMKMQTVPGSPPNLDTPPKKKHSHNEGVGKKAKPLIKDYSFASQLSQKLQQNMKKSELLVAMCPCTCTTTLN